MATNKPGTRLRHGPTQGFQALEVNGQAVHSAAMMLRETIRQKLGDDAANCLALLHIDESGTRFDWIAPFGGTITRWAAATPAERGAALAQLEALHSQILAVAQTLQAEGQRAQQTLAELLRKAIYFPGSDYVYLVDGKPVITFWGFAVSGADKLDPLRYLRLLPNTSPDAASTFAALPVAAPVADATVAAPLVVATASPSPWRWLRWFVMLLVLLLLAFFLLRACAPHIRLPWGLSTLRLPGLPAAGTAVPPVVPAVETPLPAPPPSPVAESASPPTPAVEEPSADLRIPPEAIKAKTLNFLDGRWRADAGIFDVTTKEPLIVEYLFKNGKGHTIVKKSTGARCRAPILASLQGDTLHITVEVARCDDGKQFSAERVQCQPDNDGAAKCTVRDEGGSTYATRITRMGDN